MTANKRIFWNVVATYGRSLYALVCGLFTARWVLMTLGDVDYGLIGVVGGLVGFMTFFNGLMASAVSRFYAFSVGQAQAAADPDAGLDECRRWFNVAVAIHTVIPLVSLIVGYPIGEWAVRHYLTIPPARVEACVWVFRISCLSCLVSMMSVPYRAMYTAKQEIAELTIYGFATTTLNVVFLCYMVTHQADWFIRYVGWTAFLSIAPSLIISMRSFVKYRECRFVPRYCFDWGRMVKMFRYAGCRTLNSIAMMTAFQGMTILVNKLLGPALNAAMAVGNNVCSHALSLTGAIRGAFTPAITNAAGEGSPAKVENLACRASVFSTLSVAIFAIPLILEIDEVLFLWLKEPPVQTAILVQLLLLARMIDCLTFGQCISVYAYEKIAAYQIFEAVMFFIPLPVAWLIFSCGGGLEGVGFGFVILYSMDDLVKLYFARRQCGQSIRRWFRRVFLPLFAVIFSSIASALLPRCLLAASFWRVVLTTVDVLAVLSVSTWCFVLVPTDKEKILARLKLIFLQV